MKKQQLQLERDLKLQQTVLELQKLQLRLQQLQQKMLSKRVVPTPQPATVTRYQLQMQSRNAPGKFF